jgi:hypothetical protein
LSKIEITEKFLEGRKLYFAEIQKDFFWESELYLIKTQDDVITDAVIIGASGLNRLFEYDVIDISQGEFIAAYCSSHMGSGNLELISIDNLGKSMYSIPAIDNYFEDTEETSITHGLSKEYGDGIYASKIFLNGKLSAVYEDVNDDGNTDIILKGVQQVYKNEGDVQILDSETFIKMVYLFDTHSNQFVLE